MGVLVIGLVAAMALAPAWSQDKKVGFSLNAGIQTNVWDGSSFDEAVFTLDGRAGIALGKSFEISPEFMAVFNYGSYFEMSGATLLYPGIMLNFKPGNFFVGLGLVLPWAFFEGENETGNLAPKINVGYKFGKLQVTAYMITWTEEGLDFLDANWVGLTLGYRF
jgi:hypothetical protein